MSTGKNFVGKQPCWLIYVLSWAAFELHGAETILRQVGTHSLWAQNLKRYSEAQQERLKHPKAIFKAQNQCKKSSQYTEYQNHQLLKFCEAIQLQLIL